MIAKLLTTENSENTQEAGYEIDWYWPAFFFCFLEIPQLSAMVCYLHEGKHLSLQYFLLTLDFVLQASSHRSSEFFKIMKGGVVKKQGGYTNCLYTPLCDVHEFRVTPRTPL